MNGRPRGIFTCLILALAFGLPGTGRAVNEAEPAKARTVPFQPLDPRISHVDTGGFWQHRGRSGRYRAVVYTRCSQEHCYDQLYLEWLAPLGPKQVVIAAKRIAEIGGMTHVSSARIRTSGNDTLLSVRHEAEEQGWAVCLVLGAPGEYTPQKGDCSPPP